MDDRIEKHAALNAPIEKVWRALTDHEEFGQWFGVKLDKPFEPGEIVTGRITQSGYDHVTWTATIKTMDAPRYFAFTWHPYAIDPDIDYSQEPTTLVEFRLEPTPSGTHLSVTESGFGALPSHRQAEALRMNDHGWSVQIGNVATYVEA